MQCPFIHFKWSVQFVVLQCVGDFTIPREDGAPRSSTASSRSSSAAARRDGTRALSAARQQLSRLTPSYERLSTPHRSGIKSVVRHTSQRKLSRSDSPRNSSSSGGATSAKKIGAEEVRWARWRWPNYRNRGLRQLVKNETTFKKQNKQKNKQSSSFNSGNRLNRDQQCSGLILEGNILHVSQVMGCSACTTMLLQFWRGHCSSVRPSSELLSDLLHQISNHYFQYNFAFNLAILKGNSR